MTKQETLTEIKMFRELWNQIKPKEFYFGNFVKEFDKDRSCGTVCCLWGWMPKLKPEYGVEWVDDDYDYDINYSPDRCLNWHSLLIDYLFFPEQALLLIYGLKLPILKENSRLSTVLKAWDKVINLLENTDKLDFLFKNN